ncbi:LacI family DNA-binding transcriptional regulator [Novosphingobium beihaiensis]|uniref:LacI family DNA-binding transcriptional regulator n=1 Tax=Novosphingobium beihaiensis TaxID=2930389 RepID=A0ABT0BNT9_9SPHN|nr:LacI family DNA-binding transcriptional regulator [Novosphingobium beihaiensis]MCJ2186718.1 LacI family DNA-binding transcriptional regulator [Novosphingobium beihaiensis]
MGHENGGGSNNSSGDSGATGPVRTLADLARLAGVSTGTVSRALAGKSLVNAETRERIQALAREHGFRPNQMASKLRSKRTGVIGVVIPLGHEKRQHISDPFFLTLLGWLADELTESGYDVMLSRAIPDGTSDWLERITGSGMVDGVLLIGQSDQFEVIEAVASHYRPLVAWGAYREGQVHCAVGTDNIAGGRIAAEHLIASGARSLAFMGETKGIEINERWRGAEAAAQEAGVPIMRIPISLASDDMARQIAEAAQAANRELDGIIAASDLIAMNVLRCLHEKGRAVPGDVQVIGFDDLPLASMTMPPLTTIRQEIAGGAKAMVEKLKALLEGNPAESMKMAPRLVVRGTTKGA